MKKLFLILMAVFLISCGGAPGQKRNTGYSVGVTQLYSNGNSASSVQIQKSFPTVTAANAIDPPANTNKTITPPPVGPFREPPPRKFLVQPKSQRQVGNPTRSKLPVAPNKPTPAPLQPLPSAPKNTNY